MENIFIKSSNYESFLNKKRYSSDLLLDINTQNWVLMAVESAEVRRSKFEKFWFQISTDGVQLAKYTCFVIRMAKISISK